MESESVGGGGAKSHVNTPTPTEAYDSTVSMQDEQMLKTALAFVVLRRRARGKAARQPTFLSPLSKSSQSSQSSHIHADETYTTGKRSAESAYLSEQGNENFIDAEVPAEGSHPGSGEIEVGHAWSRKRQRNTYKHGSRRNNGSVVSHDDYGCDIHKANGNNDNEEDDEDQLMPFLRDSTLRRGLVLNQPRNNLIQSQSNMRQDVTEYAEDGSIGGGNSAHVYTTETIHPNPMTVEEHLSQMFAVAVSTALPLYSQIDVHDTSYSDQKQTSWQHEVQENPESQDQGQRQGAAKGSMPNKYPCTPIYDCKMNHLCGQHDAQSSKLAVLDGITSHLSFQVRLLIQSRKQHVRIGHQGDASSINENSMNIALDDYETGENNDVGTSLDQDDEFYNEDQDHTSTNEDVQEDAQMNQFHDIGSKSWLESTPKYDTCPYSQELSPCPPVEAADIHHETNNGDRSSSTSSIIYDLLLAPYLGRILVPSTVSSDNYWGTTSGGNLPKIYPHMDGKGTDDNQLVQTVLAICTIIHHMVYSDPSSEALFLDALSGLSQIISSLYHGKWKVKIEMDEDMSTSTFDDGRMDEGRRKTREKERRTMNRSEQTKQNEWFSRSMRRREGKCASTNISSRKSLHCIQDIVAVNCLILMDEIIQLKLSYVQKSTALLGFTQTDIHRNDIHCARESSDAAREIIHELNSSLGTCITLPISTQELARFYVQHAKREQYYNYAYNQQPQQKEIFQFPREFNQSQYDRVSEEGTKMIILPHDRRLNAGARIMLRLSVFDLIQKLSCHL